MSNSIYFYKKKFDEVYQIALKKLKKNNGHVQNSVDFIMSAAAIIVKIYASKWVNHHKLDAMYMAESLNKLTLQGKKFWDAIKEDRKFLGLLVFSTRHAIGVYDDEAKLTPADKRALDKELETQLFNPTDQIKKSIISRMLSNFIKESTFAANKSDFASLAFVLVKILNLNVSNEVMEKIIKGANFSSGFMYCGSSKSRKDEELAMLNRTLYNQPELKSSIKSWA